MDSQCIKMVKNIQEILSMETSMARDFIIKKTDQFMKECSRITVIMVSANISGKMARIMKGNITLVKNMEMENTCYKTK